MFTKQIHDESYDTSGRVLQPCFWIRKYLLPIRMYVGNCVILSYT